ncbi:hypothetical protein KDW_40450 [Dictyobacter vulcani]|uniref:Uncharacterized protein n=1 Tax=Dictyobacter vulcani TaxID=2607529 RepID=A0A5J4KQK5_9CHLR|nr:hypothetical protein [Dictyobacter vulcani]GER89883.1 hypothetical protein KDW_40450 [Dictyobacter vulcani]
MSLFSDIANSIGHTVDSLAASVGVDVNMLETVVNDLDSNNINVFSTAARLGFSAESFLSNLVNLMRDDPHQILLEYLTGPVKPLNNSLSQLSLHWMQVASLHQSTAQTINVHMNELFHSSGTYSYTGSAADALWTTHEDYQKHFNDLIEGPSGPRGDSGSSIYGGSSSDPGLPVTDDMIRKGQIPTTGGGTFPPAIPLK